MHTRANENRNTRSRAVAAQLSGRKRAGNPTFQFVDNRPEVRQLMQLQTMMDSSSQAESIAQLQAMADRGPHSAAQRMLLEGSSGGPMQRQEAPEEEELQMKAGPGLLQLQGEEEDLQMKAAPGLIQRQGEEEEDLQMKVAPGLIQRQGEEEELQMKAAPGLIQRQGEEEELQMKAAPGLIQRQGEEEELQMKAAPGLIQRQGEEEEDLQMKAGPGLIQLQGMEEEEPLQGKFGPAQKKENKTGMPDDLKTGVENLSGMSMDDVKVHYNSAKPAALHALAYTQGTDIHMGPGQEQHLPHEAWHVAQQKQGRVKPTMRMAGAQINDDASLEKDADVMGNKATNEPSDKATSSRFISQFVDDRPEAIAQRKTRGTTQMNMNSTSAIQFYPSYQTFQDEDLNTYCSPKKFRNHAEGAAWVRAALQALGVKLRGRPKESNRQPRRAIVGPPWPAAATPAVTPPLDASTSSLSAYDDSSNLRESKH